MASRQREWARQKREELFDALGRICARCGAEHDLSFDCIVPMGHEHHRIEWSCRLSFYRRMHEVGNLQVLCLSCNSIKGNGRRITTRLVEAQVNSPF